MLSISYPSSSHSRKKGRPGDKWHAKVRAGVAGYQTYACKGEENREGRSGYLSHTWQATFLLEQEGHPGYG
jgi:hypothetical protein